MATKSLPAKYGAFPIDSASPGTSSSFVGSGDLTRTYALDDMPSDFNNMLATLEWRVNWETRNFVDDSATLGVRIMSSGGSTLAGASSGGAFQVMTASVSTNTTGTDSGSFTYVDTTASKADWDGASIEIQQVYSQNMGSDGGGFDVDYFFIGGFTSEYNDNQRQPEKYTFHNHSETPSLTETAGAHNLVVQSATHLHASDGSTVVITGVTLAVLDSHHGHSSENVEVPGVFFVHDAFHTHLAQAAGFVEPELQVQGSRHGHAADLGTRLTGGTIRTKMSAVHSNAGWTNTDPANVSESDDGLYASHAGGADLDSTVIWQVDPAQFPDNATIGSTATMAIKYRYSVPVDDAVDFWLVIGNSLGSTQEIQVDAPMNTYQGSSGFFFTATLMNLTHRNAASNNDATNANAWKTAIIGGRFKVVKAGGDDGVTADLDRVYFQVEYSLPFAIILSPGDCVQGVSSLQANVTVPAVPADPPATLAELINGVGGLSTINFVDY